MPLSALGIRHASDDLDSVSSPALTLPSPALTFSSASTPSISPTSCRSGEDYFTSPKSTRMSHASQSSVGSDSSQYVIALHDFSHSSAETACLEFQKGQIIRMMSVDPSGWADGELDGQRGWFPSNYVRPAKTSDLGSRRGSNDLPIASIESGDLIQTVERAVNTLRSATLDHRHSHYQPATACIISVVRSLLAKTDCLAKDSDLLNQHAVLADHRRNILGLLAGLVAQTRRSSVQSTDSIQSQNDQGLLEFCDTVLRAVNQLLQTLRQLGISTAPITSGRTPPLSPSHKAHKAKSLGNLRKSARISSLQDAPPVPTKPTEQSRSSSESSDSGPGLSPANSSSDSIPLPQTPREPTFHSTSERLLELGGVHDKLLSTLGAFIGHVHAHTRASHSSSFGQLVDIASEVVALVRELLRLSDAATADSKAGFGPSADVDNATATRAKLYDATTAFVNAVRNISDGPILGDEPDEEIERTALLFNATNILREARSNVAAVRRCLHRKDAAAKVFELVAFDTDRPMGGDIHLMDQHGTSRQAFSMLAASTDSLAELKERFGADVQQSGTGPTLVARRGLTAPQRIEIARSTNKLSVVSEEDTHSMSHLPLSVSSAANSDRRQNFGSPSDSQQVTEQHAERSYQPFEICFNNDGQVIGGTLHCLIERMTLHDTTIDPLFQATFFLTFRLFTSPLELLHSLFDRFNVAPAPEIVANPDLFNQWSIRCGVPIRLRVFNIFKSWLETHWDGQTDAEILQPLQEFTAQIIQPKLDSAAHRLLDLIEKRSNAKMPVQRPKLLHKAVSSDRLRSQRSFRPSFFGPHNDAASADTEAPAPAMSRATLHALRTIPFSQIAVTDLEPLEVARQLTIMESRLYCAIKAKDLLLQNFGGGKSVCIKNMSSQSTRITGWIVETILSQHEAKKRSYTVKYFIKVAEKCHLLRNFNTLMAVLAALNSSTITRLKRTWDALPQKYRTSMNVMRKMVEHTRNYSEYRNALRAAPAPCLPFVGLYLTDITFCCEGNPPTRSAPSRPDLKLINFDRYQKMHKIVSDLQRFQTPYNLLEVPEIQIYLEQCLQSIDSNSGPNSLDRLYRQSMILEPRTPGAQQSDLYNW